MQHTTIAVDLAKSVFQVAVSHHTGRVDEEHRLTRARFLRFFAQRPAATVLLEACGSAHHWARTLEQLGHTVQLLPPHETRRYVRRNKTDRADAKALLEAARNEEIHPVPVKSVSQQAVASLHRVRTTWVRTRTARLNTLRGTAPRVWRDDTSGRAPRRPTGPRAGRRCGGVRPDGLAPQSGRAV